MDINSISVTGIETERVAPTRAHYLPANSMFGLHAASSEIMSAYDTLGVYLVGSCLSRRDYRDVDVRAIMEDEEFDKAFPHNPNGVVPNTRPLFMLSCLSISLWFKELSGLPVDFQFQKQSIANARHKGPRNALGHYRWTGDATD